MVEIISYFVIPLLVILVVAYFYIEMQKRKIKEQNKKAIILRVSTMKSDFKVEIKRLVEQQILTIREQELVYRIANNFFVFQPVTNNNIDYCEYLLKNVISAMQTGGPDSINFELVREQVSLFVRSLPATASGHNAAFYHNELPELIKQLVQYQENRYETDPENESNNKEPHAPLSATAA